MKIKSTGRIRGIWGTEWRRGFLKERRLNRIVINLFFLISSMSFQSPGVPSTRNRVSNLGLEGWFSTSEGIGVDLLTMDTVSTTSTTAGRGSIGWSVPNTRTMVLQDGLSKVWEYDSLIKWELYASSLNSFRSVCMCLFIYFKTLKFGRGEVRAFSTSHTRSPHLLLETGLHKKRDSWW